MYSTLVPHKPGRAAVPSIWGAQTEFDHWLRENDYSKVTDADGTVWDVSVQIRETPDLAGERMINKLRVVLKARLAVDDLDGDLRKRAQLCCKCQARRTAADDQDVYVAFVARWVCCLSEAGITAAESVKMILHGYGSLFAVRNLPHAI